ncbi:hypothetical protein [Desulfotomaculum copahuensis]|uniref:Uncharacterized protein n=1 Tax=Desulfotomaculum copahuensis TaxID=1838280 RepID=A0A1B7LH28_9FIRM|nr:hypothetical protein [Desulfotomaculum copahuensis]OAT85309.1 hypothetical protein A6M21_17335 [Desulfotomaculum copahuensis]
MSSQANASEFPFPEQGKLTEFDYNIVTSTYGISTAPVLLASTVVLVNNANNRVWLNGTVDWSYSFAGGSGTASVLFEVLRGDTVIYSAMQSIVSVVTVGGFIVYNQAHLQHVDTTPVPAAQTPFTAPFTPVLYKLQARVLTAPAGGGITSAPAVLTAAEVIPNSPVRF